MKDKIGQELEIGDKIVFNPPRYKGLVFGRIIKFTPKGVRIAFEHQSRPCETVMSWSDVVKLPVMEVHRPFAIVPSSACATDNDCDQLKKLAERMDLVIVTDENLESTVMLLKQMRKPELEPEKKKDSEIG